MNLVQIKRSSTTQTPPLLEDGELAYSSASNNLFIGEAGNVITKIGGKSEVTKLASIEAGAQVNTVDSVAGKTGTVTLGKADVGLGNVDNTLDVDKPVSTAQQNALNLKANVESPTFTGTVSGISAAMVGLGNVTNESKETMFTSPVFINQVTLGATNPTASNHAASKAYVDSMAAGLLIKEPVRVATTGSIVLAGTQTVDGVSLSVGDRVLVKNQSPLIYNGIYLVQSSGWLRALDADNSSGPDSEVRNGTFVMVSEGTQANTQWVLNVSGSVIFGTTPISFVQYGALSTYTAGAGLTQTGSVFEIDSTTVATKTAGELNTVGGANITGLNASNISTGTIANARLSADVMLTTSAIDGGTF